MLIKGVVFICGAIVMSYEILGSRVLAPNFGGSVFVWGSLISVFLAGLSAGYYLGGRVADLNASSRKLAAIIVVPGLMMLAFPFYGNGVSDWIFMQDLGVRLSPLVASLALFFVPSIFLGAVSPYTVKLTICDLQTSGSTVGTLYALSTFGSIVGTLVTSFYLITVAGVKTIIMLQGATLIVMALPLYAIKLYCAVDEQPEN